MANKSSRAVIVRCTLTLTLITFIITVLLAAGNAITKDRIAANAVEKAALARTAVLPAASFKEAQVTPAGAETPVTYYEAQDASGATLGYVFTTASSGYGGPVTVMTGVASDGSITGVQILAHGETPGLGANATNSSWLGQFKGLSGELKVKKDDPSGQIDALTSATLTTRAVTRAVNAALALCKQIQGGSGK